MRAYHADPKKLAAPDPEPTPQLVRFVAHRYGLSLKAPPRDLGGSFNLNLLLDGHVVRVYGPWVSAARVGEVQRIRQAVARRGIPTPELRPANDGAPHCTFGENVIEVERFVPGTPMRTLGQVHAGMRLLGRLHTAMADLCVQEPAPIANHLPADIALAATLDATAAIRSWHPTAAEDRFARLAQRLARSLRDVPSPPQTVHGDFWDNNVLFGDIDPVAVLDFDFADNRPRVDDLAVPLAYLAQASTGVSVLRSLVDAYDGGAAVPLSRRERRALPHAMARVALSFLQYLLIPADPATAQQRRREFVESRGPACEWWLQALAGDLRADAFV